MTTITITIISITIMYKRFRLALFFPLSQDKKRLKLDLRLLFVILVVPRFPYAKAGGDASRAEPLFVLFLWIGSIVYHCFGNGIVVTEARIVQWRTPVLVLCVYQACISA